MGRYTCWHTRGIWGHFKEHGPKSLLKTPIMVESKVTSWCQKPKRGGGAQQIRMFLGET